MGTKITGKYTGSLRNNLIHNQSNKTIITDAPLDNNGKGESFSPTDLVAAALGSCMLTIIAIRANSKNINIGNPTYEIKKHMESSPRKISVIEINIIFFQSFSEDQKSYLEEEAKNCPVALSIDSSIEQRITFNYSN